MSKKTLLFSNVIGNIMEDDITVRFNDYMEEYLTNNLDNTYSMLFIEAPGLGGEENYLPNIIRCFNKAKIEFKEIMRIDNNTDTNELNEFYKRNEKILMFLMGGDPYTQLDIINKYNLKDRLKNQEDLVIGFCAGAINLSAHSIITSDEDFKNPDSYEGIGREDICIEPHFNDINDSKRIDELKNFSKQFNTKIYCIPDESIMYFEDGIKYEKGDIYTINNKSTLQ